MEAFHIEIKCDLWSFNCANLREKRNSQSEFQNPLITSKFEPWYKKKPKLPPERSCCEVLNSVTIALFASSLLLNVLNIEMSRISHFALGINTRPSKNLIFIFLCSLSNLSPHQKKKKKKNQAFWETIKFCSVLLSIPWRLWTAWVPVFYWFLGIRIGFESPILLQCFRSSLIPSF